ncbi:MAG: hypothetical protein Q8T03_15060 [Bacteroidota bacterium]|nr:hypothetical protein [Bacteroidota bacterium]
MKKITLIFVLALILHGVSFKAQNPTYNQLVSIINTKMPGLDASNKLIAFQVWSTTDVKSRDANKEFDRLYTIYENVKFKDAHKGTIVISCNIDDVTLGNITSTKDGIKKVISINKSEFSFLNSLTSGTNLMYNNNTIKVYENLPTEKIWNSYTQLIIR